MRKQSGFTVIELLAAIVALAVIGIVFWTQFNNVQVAARDDKRRTAINAMYYDLEDVFYAKNHYYPKTIDDKNLTAMDKALLTDPQGVKIGEADSDYRYEPTDCNGDQCKGYTLRATMENEADFVKTSRNN